MGKRTIVCRHRFGIIVSSIFLLEICWWSGWIWVKMVVIRVLSWLVDETARFRSRLDWTIVHRSIWWRACSKHMFIFNGNPQLFSMLNTLHWSDFLHATTLEPNWKKTSHTGLPLWAQSYSRKKRTSKWRRLKQFLYSCRLITFTSTNLFYLQHVIPPG